MPDLLALAGLLLLGGVVALDGTSVGQFMISRPLIAGSLAGLVAGDPETGLLVGALLEGANLGAMPAGASRFLEPGPAAIPAVVTAISLGGGGGLALGTGVGILMSIVGGESVVFQRRWNERILHGVSGFSSLSRRFLLCIATDGLRGVVLTGAGLGLAALLPDLLDGHWTPAYRVTIGLLILPSALVAGALLDRWRLTTRRWAIFAAALVCGFALAGAG